ncbi:hypothetical protein [Streptomyces spectabilis]|uniref:hypothetical protein n=1 Tax=Streptomyces spectabilis TaxID=68270 RepID=UPI00340482B3
MGAIGLWSFWLLLPLAIVLLPLNLSSVRRSLLSAAEFEATGAAHWQGRVLEMLGESAEGRGDTGTALHWYERSLTRYTSAGAPDVDRLTRRIRQLPPPDAAAPRTPPDSS